MALAYKSGLRMGLCLNGLSMTEPKPIYINPHLLAVPLYTDDEVKELVAMFPNVEEEVVRSVLDMKRGDKDATVTALIEMSS